MGNRILTCRQGEAGENEENLFLSLILSPIQVASDLIRFTDGFLPTEQKMAWPKKTAAPLFQRVAAVCLMGLLLGRHDGAVVSAVALTARRSWVLSVWSLHFLSVSGWVLSRHSSFLPQSTKINLRPTENSELFAPPPADPGGPECRNSGNRKWMEGCCF